MAEQIKFGDRLFLKGEKLILDSVANAVIKPNQGTLEIEGNLLVSGTTTTVNSETVSIADPFMLLNGDLTSSTAPTEPVGIEINRGSSDNKKFGWDETNSKFSTFSDDLKTAAIEATDIVLTGSLVGDIASELGDTIIDVTGNGTVDINSGNIDGTVIGATAPAQATFTSLTWSTTSNTTDDLTEGTTNQYYTDARARAAISMNAGSELTYDPATGIISFSGNYYQDSDARQAISVTGNEIGYDNTTGVISYDAPTDFGLLTDTNVISGSTGGSTGSSLPTNVSSLFNDAGYVTQSYQGFSADWQADDVTNLNAAKAYTDQEISAVIDVAPLQLNTLKKLAAAINNDATYNDTIQAQINGLAVASNLSTVATTGSFNDLLDQPTIPVNISDLPNDSGYLTSGDLPTNYMINNGNNTVAGSITPLNDASFSLGTPTKRWEYVYGETVEATYADLAERYEADDVYEPGTVLIFGGDKEVTKTDVHTDYRVAGVVSTNPAYKMNSDAGADDTHPYIALRGRVPCKVVGPVAKGDLMVTSSVKGHAKSVAGADMGRAVFAKSLTNDASEGSKIIEVVIL
ncbi:MAG: hypothetical protein CMD92_04745 [Gammaproteobacteria bacterium]|nr:hypothetical protein [Gammaproteobacteria bacterium]